MCEWIKDASFYHIYPLGLCGAPFKNDLTTPPVQRISQLKRWTPYLQEMGINAVYFGPLFESESHGYDTVNYHFLDRRLGTNDNLIEVIRFFHDYGIKIILDAVFNHTSRNFFAFKDLLQYGAQSQYKDWYSGIDFTRRSPLNDPFSYNCWNGHYTLVKLNLQNKTVQNYLFDCVKQWISDFEIDGLRLDTADCLDFNFMSGLRDVCKKANPDFWIMGEVIHGDYSRWANDNTIHSTTNYEGYKGLYSSHNDLNYFEIAYSLNRQYGTYGIYKNLFLYNFADNHDVTRVASILKEKKHLFPLYTLLYTIPGIPSIYYGSEFGIEGVKNHDDSSLRPSLNLYELKETMPGLRQWICTLIALRKSSSALKSGTYRQLYVNHKQFVFEREHEKEKVVVAVNSDSSDSPLIISCQDTLVDMITGKTYNSINGKLQIIIPPFSGMMLRKR